MPADRLKLDASLIRNMASVEKDSAIVRAVIFLGREAGFEVLAEGVETDDQLQMLLAFGCQEAQGYLLGRPVCASDAGAYLQSPCSKIVQMRAGLGESVRHTSFHGIW